MVKAGDRAFFMEKIYQHERSEIDRFSITVRARVHPLFFETIKAKKLTPMEEEDLKLRFSVCCFFVVGKGCGLNPAYKPSVCRSFICSTIEERLDESEVLALTRRVRQIRNEARAFENVHRARLEQKNGSLKTDIESILDYLSAIE